MRIVSLIICTFLVASVNSQNVIEYLKDKGFFIEASNEKFVGQVSSETYYGNPFSEGGSQKETEKDNITSSQLNACLEGDVFAYYESLYKYNTPLKQKLYKEDNPSEFAEYQSKLSNVKDYYVNGYQYKEVRFEEQSNYNLEKKTFSLFERFYNSSRQLEFAKKQIGLGNLVLNNGDESPYVVAPIIEVKQAYVPSKEYGFKIKTTIKVENERDALKIENNGNLKMIVFYNQVSKKKDVITPLKVIFHINGEIIKSIGVNSRIDGLIEGYTPKPMEKESSKEEEYDLGNVFGEGTGGGTAGGDGNDNSSGYGGVGNDSGYGDGTSRRIKHIPNLDNLTTVPAKVAIKIKISSQGEVFWSEAQLHNPYTNTTNKNITYFQVPIFLKSSPLGILEWRAVPCPGRVHPS